MSVYACSPLPTLLQYTSSVRALASPCSHDGVYRGVIAPELGVWFLTIIAGEMLVRITVRVEIIPRWTMATNHNGMVFLL